jgi:hypothetical protein
MDPDWRSIEVPPNSQTSFYLTLSEPGGETYEEYLWTTTDVLTHEMVETTTIEKFNHWNDDNSDVGNYGKFYIFSSTNQEIGRLKKIGGTLIRTELVSGGSGGRIEFKDPWYPNGSTLGGIAKNKGTNADWFTFQTILEIEP